MKCLPGVHVGKFRFQLVFVFEFSLDVVFNFSVCRFQPHPVIQAACFSFWLCLNWGVIQDCSTVCFDYCNWNCGLNAKEGTEKVHDSLRWVLKRMY